jgi:phosphatidate cytidylyltransferase
LIRAPALVFVLFLIGGTGEWVAARRLDAAERRIRLIKFSSYFAIVYSVLLAAMLSRRLFTGLILVVLLQGTAELRRAVNAGAWDRTGGTAIWSAWILSGAGLLAFAWVATAAEHVLVYTVVVTMDGFSQVTGHLAGRHFIAKHISPAKTAEGVAGGALAAILAGYYLGSAQGLSWGHSLALGSTVAGAAYAGDIAASWVKRGAGIKDFGTLLPGHGGVLDRFDSLIGAGAAAFLLLTAWKFGG